jgi:ankyrin repeat protein
MDLPAKHRNNSFSALHAVINAQRCGRDPMLVHILRDPSRTYSTEQRGEDGLTPLMLAAKLGCHEAVELLIEYGASSRSQDDNGFTALHWAVARGHEQVVQTLLRKKASIRRATADGLNPLQRAFSDGSPGHANLPMVKLLLEYGADANDLWDSSKRLTVLHQAVKKSNKDLVVLLLAHEASTITRDDKGRSAIEYDRDGSMVELLIEHSLSQKNACGRDLICAAKFCKLDLIRRLVSSGVDVNSRDSRGQTALLRANVLADEHFDTLYDDIDDDVGYEKHGVELIGALHVLLEVGANPCIPDDDLRTPANSTFSCTDELFDLYEEHVTSVDRRWPTNLHQAVAVGNLSAVEDLLNDEAHVSRIDARDDHGFTAMHYAILWGRGDTKEIIKHLVDKNANPNISDKYGCTPLHHAVVFRGGPLPLLKIMLGAGGSLDVKDRLGRRPADIAILHAKMDVLIVLTERTNAKFTQTTRGRGR